MSETLGQKQRRFALLVSRLIDHAYYMGYEVSLGDAYRDPRLHGAHGDKQGYGAARSCHKLRLAIDLNLFRDGKLLADTEGHRPLGESVQLQIEAAFGSTGADMWFRVVGTLDASAENADTVAFIAGSLGFVASTTQRRSITLSNVYKYRVEVRKGGTTAGSYTPNVYVRKNGISI